ncbi:hypothetical protein C8R46DRAFT_1257572 [Mycena filopes]|nr:hypothetical protein C8R46DRAFT_1257572 [Mycena filopes]
MSPSSFAVGPLSNRPPSYQNQYNLVNEGGFLRLAAVSRRILALPPEILAEIFVHCLPQWPYSDARDAPHSLCCVCCQFRAVALSTPRLWSSMCIDLENKDEEGAYIDFCRTWLSRTGNLPISLLLVDDIEKEIPPDPEDSLLPVIMGLAERLRALEIGGTFWSDILNGEHGSITGRLPLLEELTISTYSELGSVFLPNAPKLRIVSVDVWRPIQVPWHQLTKISIGYIDVPSFLTTLQNATRLLQASFDFYAWSDQSSYLPVSDYSHARLRRLHFGVSEDGDRQIPPLSLLHHLKTPALQSLSLAPWSGSVSVDMSPLLSFLSQPSLRLQTMTLAFDYIKTPMINLIECLKLSSSLTHLRLTLRPISDLDGLFAQLTGRPEFLPTLEYFELKIPLAYAYPTVSAVVKMLCWRWAAVGITQLQSFRLQDRSEALKSHPDVRRLESEGMRLYTGANTTAGDDVFWDF